MIVASYKDAFFVHKTMNEYLTDIGSTRLNESDFLKWVEVLDSQKHRYVLLMHSRKVVGMVWGQDVGGEFWIQGKFLRRAYRGKFKFTRKLLKAKLEIVKGYDTIKVVRPACAPIGKRKVAAYIL
jgi:hypothetical protein